MIALPAHTASELVQNLVGQAGWRNSKSAIVEAFPHLADELGPEDVVRTLENLRIPFSRIRAREAEITDDECPSLVFPRGRDCYVALGLEREQLRVWQPATEQDVHLRPRRISCDIIRVERHRFETRSQPVATVQDAFKAWRPMLPWLLVSSLLVNILGLLAPLLIMGIYDRVIPSGSIEFLIALAIGVAIVLITDFSLRHARTKALAYVARQGEGQLAGALFEKLLGLPLGQLQKSAVDQQVSRFRQFETFREVFTGQVATTLLDLPFALIFLCVLFYLSPAVGLLATGVAVFFVILSALTISTKQRLDEAVAQGSAEVRAMMHDTVVHQSIIGNLGLGDVWRNRTYPIVEAAEEATRRARQFDNNMQSLAQSVSALATMGAIVLSAHAAMSGDMSFGALIAVIALISKVLAPIQGLHANLPQILSLRQVQGQADRVLSLPPEFEIGLGQSHIKSMSGRMALNAITFRPDPHMPPLLSNASMVCRPGEVVLVFGSDVACRTALLDLLDGLHTPLAGSVEHDDIDIRQIARDDLRNSISYATFELGMFYGTLAQNFRLAAPTLTDAEIAEALDTMRVSEEVARWPEGSKTRLSDAVMSAMPKETHKALSLARCIARNTPIYLFSEPTNDLGQHRRAAFKTWLRSVQGEKTVVIATADRSLLEIADRCVFIDDGRITVHDCGEAGRKKLTAALNNRS